MKKYLLFAVSAMFAANVCAQGVDITPEGFKYSEKEVGPFEPDGAYSGANLQRAGVGQVPFATIFEECGEKGLFLLSGGAPADGIEAANFPNLIAGMAIVDLGGEVGKVLAISGVNSKINEVMPSMFEGYTGTLPLATGEHSLWNFNWTSDPAKTPLTDGTNNFRMRFVVNIFANEFSESTDILKATYNSTATRNVIPAGSNEVAPHVKSGEFIQLYEDGDPVLDDDDNYVWDPTKWLVYEFDTNAPAEESVPIRMKMEVDGGQMHNATIFIKEVQFLELGEEDERISEDNGYRKTFKKFEVNPVNAVNAINAENNAEKKIYTVSGIEVGSKNQKGVYVEKVGNKTRKVVVR